MNLWYPGEKVDYSKYYLKLTGLDKDGDFRPFFEDAFPDVCSLLTFSFSISDFLSAETCMDNIWIKINHAIT